MTQNCSHLFLMMWLPKPIAQNINQFRGAHVSWVDVRMVENNLRGRGRVRGGGRGGERGGRPRPKVVISDDIRATVIDHVLVHGMTMREAGLRVQPKLSRFSVATIVRTFREEDAFHFSIWKLTVFIWASTYLLPTEKLLGGEITFLSIHFTHRM